MTELARDRSRAEGFEDRIDAASSDYLEDPIPEGGLVTANLILHQENQDTKERLMENTGEQFGTLAEEPGFDDLPTRIPNVRHAWVSHTNGRY